MHHQLVTLGEAMLRLSVRPGDRIEDTPAFQVHVAGSEANVAYAAARVGLKSAWISALPDNPLGHRVDSELTAGGVDTSLVRWVPDALPAVDAASAGDAVPSEVEGVAFVADPFGGELERAA